MNDSMVWPVKVNVKAPKGLTILWGIQQVKVKGPNNFKRNGGRKISTNFFYFFIE